MAIARIDDPADDRLTDYRNIPDSELVERRGIFVAEGRLVVRRLLETNGWATRSVMVTETAMASIQDLLNTRPDLAVYVVSQAAMSIVAGFDIHRGCLAIGERRPALRWQQVARDARRLVALERVGNPDNVGSVFRSAAAFRADGVLLGPACADPLYRKSIRTSMGAALTMPFARAEPWPAALNALREEGWTVVGMTPSPLAPLLRESVHDRRRPIVLVLGHEGDGLTPEALAACDGRARIATSDAVDSLNVATAAAIALYEFTR